MQDYDEELQKLQSCLRVEQERLNKENKKPPADWLQYLFKRRLWFNLTVNLGCDSYHLIVNVALSLISSMPFVAKREDLILYDTITSETLRRYS